MKTALFSVVACVLFGCSTGITGPVSFWDQKTLEVTPEPNSVDDQLEALVSIDPRKLATSACQNGDFRFVGVMGVEISIPGLTAEDPRIEQHGLKVISWTSDDIESEIQARVVAQAVKFAEDYNVQLLRHLSQRSG